MLAKSVKRFGSYEHLKFTLDLAEIWYLEVFGVLVSNIKSDFTCESFQNFVIRKHIEQ